jgi:hypothetical protein
MPTGHTTPLPPSTSNRDTLRAVVSPIDGCGGWARGVYPLNAA